MGLMQYLAYLALISVSLGVLNLLPLPVLDGGHLMYYLWEGVTGKSVSDTWMEYLQRGGVAVLALMMSIALFNDIHPVPCQTSGRICLAISASVPFMKKHITRLGVRTASAVAAMVFVANAAWALEPFKVQDIRVEGLQRVEPGTIFASMPLRVGDDYNDDKGAAAIRALFALGLFKDVRLEAQWQCSGGGRGRAPHHCRRRVCGHAVNSTRKFSRKPCGMSV